MNLKFNVVTKDMHKLGYMTNASDTVTAANIQNQVNQLTNATQAGPIIGALTKTLGNYADTNIQDTTSVYGPTPRF